MDHQSIFVEPSFPLVPGYTKLHGADQVENRFIIPSIGVFRVADPKSRQSIVEYMQTGLSNTIADMPFLAAHVIPAGEDRDTVQLEIPTGEAGVWLHVKEIPHMEYLALELRQFPFSEMPLLPLMPEPRLHHPEKSPVLTVQVTFINNGLLLTLNAHHSVMDGSGMAAVYATLAQHTAAASEGRLISSGEITTHEVQDRSNIFRGTTRLDLSDFPTYRVTPHRWRSAMERELVEAAISGDHPKCSILKELDVAHWFFSDESLVLIKKAALPLTADQPVLTDNTILCALVWRHITRARQLSARGVETSSFICPVNFRRRLNPPLPLNYPGNAIVHAKTTSATADVESKTPGMLYTMAKQITDSVEWWTSERLWELLGVLESSPYIGRIEPAMDIFHGHDVEVTSNVSSGEFLKLKWGDELGTIRAVRYPYLTVKDGWVNFLPRGHLNGIEVVTAMDKETIKRLRMDREWTDMTQEFR
jgi:hypothetical protein